MDDKKNLENVNNYKKTFKTSNPLDYIFKYIELIHNFLNYSKHNINMSDIKLNKYIIIKGIEVLNSIFNIILLYTKNIDLAYYNTQIAYCYYIEFIGQIEDDDNSFLKLSVKDAILFIYRKIIYTIDQDYRSNYRVVDNEAIMLNDIRNATTKYNYILFRILDKYESIIRKTDKNNILESIINSNTKLFNKYITFNKYIIVLEYIGEILDKLFENDADLKTTYIIIEQFIKIYIKHVKKDIINHTNIIRNISNLKNIDSKTNNKIVKAILGTK